MIVLGIYLLVVWMAGGAARADVVGQLIVRVASVAAAVYLTLSFRRWDRRALPLAALLGSAALLTAIQLLPLPPAIWSALPGRDVIDQSSSLIGETVWRPMSLMPGSTANALISLIVPAGTLGLLMQLEHFEVRFVPYLVMGLVLGAASVGILQFSGITFDNPFVNDTRGDVNGLFANRNHFALFMAIGCLIAPKVLCARGQTWKLWIVICICLELLFVILILASGSRSGILVGFLGLILGFFLAWKTLFLTGVGARGWRSMISPALAIVALGVLVMVSVQADRAVSINRLLGQDLGSDFRRTALPVVWAMIRQYFPFGSGFGGFDAKFMMVEPFDLLKPTYFNHAHNDWLEVVIDGGLPGLILMGIVVVWWAVATIRVWKSRTSTEATFARLGSCIILLVMISSCFDYPARTPLMMSILVIAAYWLTAGRSTVQAEPSTTSGRAQRHRASPKRHVLADDL